MASLVKTRMQREGAGKQTRDQIEAARWKEMRLCLIIGLGADVLQESNSLAASLFPW